MCRQKIAKRFMCSFFCFILTLPYEIVSIIIPNVQIQKLRLRKDHVARDRQGQNFGSSSSPPCWSIFLICGQAERSKGASGQR